MSSDVLNMAMSKRKFCLNPLLVRVCLQTAQGLVLDQREAVLIPYLAHFRNVVPQKLRVCLQTVAILGIEAPAIVLIPY